MEDTTAPEIATPEGNAVALSAPVATQDKAPKGPSRAELASQIAALTAQMAERDKAASEAVKASTAEAERIAADKAQIETERKALALEARAAAADKLGILPKALALAPEVDPRTPEGAKALSDWAVANPEFVRSATAASGTFAPPPQSMLAQVISGAVKHPYAEQIRNLVSNLK